MSAKQKSLENGSSHSIDSSLRELMRSIKAKETVVFCGAGISRHSGLPIVDELMPYILEKLELTTEETELIVNSNLPFEAFIETLHENSDPGKIFDIFDLGKPNTNHILLAKLAKAGYVTTICTTNFDRLIEEAFDGEGLVRGDDYRVYFKEDDFDNADWQDKIISLIKIHGSVEDKDSMRIILAQVASKVLSAQRKGVIDRIFSKGAHMDVLVLGYSCSDVFDISPQIEAIQDNHKKVILIDHHRNECAVKNLADKKEKNPFHHFGESKWILYDTDKLIEAIWSFCLFEEEFVLSESGIDKATWQECVNTWYLETEEKYSGVSKYSIAAQVFSKIAEFENAKNYFEQALCVAQEIGDKQTEGSCLGNLGGVCYNLGDYQKAVEYHERALGIAREIGDRSREGSWLGNLGSVCGSVGDYQKAISYYEQALSIAEEIGDRNGEGRHLGNLGNAYGDLGDFRKAIEYYEQALGIAREIGDKNGEERHLGHLGIAYRNLGDYQKAIDFHEQALGTVREIGDRNGEGRHLGNLGNAYHDIGDYQKAIDFHEQALGIARKIGHKNGEGRHLGNLGNAYYSLGDSKKAIEYYEQALGIAREIGDRNGEERRLCYLGVAHSNLDDHQEAIDCHERALGIAREIGDKKGEERCLGNLGGAYHNLGDYQKTIGYYEQALSIAEEIGDKWGQGNWRANLGVVYGNLSDYQKAITYSEQALDGFRPMLGDSHTYVKRIEEYLFEAKSRLKR